MASSRTRFMEVAALLAIGGVIAFATTRGGQDSANPRQTRPPTLSGNCLSRGGAVDAPKWYPPDLTMPPGSYPMEELQGQRGIRRVVFAAKGDLRAFVVHALREWKKNGWTLGRGESEPGEAEDNFLKGDRYGVFRARSIFCEQDWTWVLMVIADRTAPTPGFNRQTTATPSPLSS